MKREPPRWPIPIVHGKSGIRAFAHCENAVRRQCHVRSRATAEWRAWRQPRARGGMHVSTDLLREVESAGHAAIHQGRHGDGGEGQSQ
jgi:hypothetical protein